MSNWKKRSKRFVLFVDILGFKDLVARNSHSYIEKKLAKLTEVLEKIPKDSDHLDVEKEQTKPISFSDSILIFSRGAQKKDAEKILMDAHHIQYIALKNQIPIKGAISYGEITVDFEKSIFFGQPIIDAYLLHEELQLLSVLIDHHAEKRIDNFKSNIRVYKNISSYATPMRYGRINHKLLRLADPSEGLNELNYLYHTVSGKPRIYIDNTVTFYKSLCEKEKI